MSRGGSEKERTSRGKDLVYAEAAQISSERWFVSQISLTKLILCPGEDNFKHPSPTMCIYIYTTINSGYMIILNIPNTQAAEAGFASRSFSHCMASKMLTHVVLLHFLK